MIRMTELPTIGTPLGNELTAIEELEAAVLESPTRVEIAQVRQTAYGIVMPATAAHRDAYGLRPGVAAVLWWTDGEADGGSSGLNAVSAIELYDLIGSSTQAAIDELVAEYRRHPPNERDPGYRLYMMETGGPAGTGRK